MSDYLANAVFDAIETRIDESTTDGIGADGRYNRAVHLGQRQYVDGLRSARLTALAVIRAAQTPPLLSQEEAFQRAVKAGIFNGLVSKPEDTTL